jgi:hypothetical protein
LHLTASGERRTNYSLASTLDPLLGIFTGVFAYYLYETNHRTAPSPEQKLDALVRWKIEKYQAGRAQRDSAGTGSEADQDWSKALAQVKEK